MIDWGGLAANALWIIGCALGLGTLSYANWDASAHKEKLRARLKHPSYQVALNLAGFLFSLGLAATGTTLEIVLWLILGALFLAQVIAAVIAAFVQKRSDKASPSTYSAYESKGNQSSE